MLTNSDHCSSLPPGSLQAASSAHAPREFNELPFEITSYILTLAMYAEHNATSQYRFPSVICRISRNFYKIAQATQHIWSCILITTSNRTKFLHAQDRILKKTGTLPLSIHLEVQPLAIINPKAIVRILTKCSNRWESLSLLYQVTHFQDAIIWHMFNSLIRVKAPRLDYIAVYAPHVPEILGTHHPTIHLPSGIFPIRSLHMTNCNYLWRSTKSRFPTSLQSLSVVEAGDGYFQGDVFESIKPVYRSLKSLSLGGFYLYESILPDQVPINSWPFCVMESLESLKITAMQILSVIKLLYSFRAPNLKHLSLDILPTDHTGLTNSSLRGRKTEIWTDVRFPHLSHLTLASLPNPSTFHDLWVEFLQSLPGSVTNLEIKRPAGRTFGNILSTLRHPRTDAFCHQLEYITADGLTAPNSIISVIDGRCPSLKLLKLNVNDMQLGSGYTRDSFERRKTLIDYLKGLVNVEMMEWEAIDLEEPTFATWEEYQAYEAQNPGNRSSQTI